MFEMSLRWVRQMFAQPDYIATIHTRHGSIQAELLSHDAEPQRSRFHFWFVSPWLTQVDRIEIFCGKRLVSMMEFEGSPWLSPGMEFQYSHTRGFAGDGRFVSHHIARLRDQQRSVYLN